MRRLVAIALSLVAMTSLLACSSLVEDEKVILSLEEVIHVSSGEKSRIFAVQGTNGADQGVERLLELMAAQELSFYKTAQEPDGLIGKDDVVLLKFNCQWAERGGTNTDLIKSVVQAITSHPESFQGEVIIADNGQAQYGSSGRGGSIQWSHSNALDTDQSVKKVAEDLAQEHKVSALTWDSITLKKVEEYCNGDYYDGFIVDTEKTSTGYYVSYPKFTTQYGTFVSFKEGIWNDDEQRYDSDKLKVINMPVLKTHVDYRVTACIKNYMGTVSDRLTNHTSHRSIISGGMGTQMVSTRMPILNILDAIWINPYPRSGPSCPYYLAVETNIIAASTDPAALDYWAVKNILMAAAEQMGINGVDSLDPDQRTPGTLGYWMDKSREEIEIGGYRASMDPEEINVYVGAVSNRK